MRRRERCACARNSFESESELSDGLRFRGTFLFRFNGFDVGVGMISSGVDELCGCGRDASGGKEVDSKESGASTNMESTQFNCIISSSSDATSDKSLGRRNANVELALLCVVKLPSVASCEKLWLSIESLGPL